MWRVQVQEEDSKLEAENQIKYIGTARIGLKWLHFQPNQPRELDDKNVERLKSIFRKDCRRLDVHNHIPAVIEQQALEATVHRSGISPRQLSGGTPNGYPELDFPTGYQVECLHGKHRIQAAKELRLGWWTVDLYLSDLNPSLRTCLVEEYSNEKKPGEGEIYCKIRQYHFQRNLYFERRWWSRLTTHGERCLKQLFRHSELTAAFDALLGIPGLWGRMRISTLHTILATKCFDEILCYLRRIKDVFYTLLQGDTNALLLVDQETVEAIELKAPRTSTRDASILRGQLQGGLIFSAFSDQARADIWTRLQVVDGLIPSLFTFFKDILYLEALAGCMTRLITLLPGETMSAAFGRVFSDTHERTGRAIIQVAESHFASCPIDSVDVEDLGYRQLFAYAMRHYLEMPKDHGGEELLARPTTTADGTVLREFADLAECLGFHSPEITALKRHPKARPVITASGDPKPSLVTTGAGVKRKRRFGLPIVVEYKGDRESLFLNHLHDRDEEHGEGVTSFLVRKSIYKDFFGELPPLPLGDLCPKDSVTQERQHQQRQESLKQEWQKQKRLEQEWQEQERREQEQQRQREQQRQEQAEKERQEQERREQEQQRQREQQRQEQADNERREQEQQRQKEQERQEQAEKERREQEQQRQREEEKQEQERREQEQQRQREQERQEQAEKERQEQERREQEQQRQREQERQEQAEKERQEQEQEEQRKAQSLSLDDERRLEDQQRMEQDELLEESNEEIGWAPGEGIVEGRSSEAQTGISSNTMNRITFRIHDKGVWKQATSHIIDHSDHSEIEKAAMHYVREKRRLFNTELRMLAPQQCYEAAIADGTYTILLMQESEINIDYDLILSAMKVGAEAKEAC